MAVQFHSTVPSQSGVCRRVDNPNMYYQQGVNACQAGLETLGGTETRGNSRDSQGMVRDSCHGDRQRSSSLIGGLGDLLHGDTESDGAYSPPTAEAPVVVGAIPGQPQPEQDHVA